jgi:hypothetical protein
MRASGGLAQLSSAASGALLGGVVLSSLVSAYVEPLVKIHWWLIPLFVMVSGLLYWFGQRFIPKPSMHTVITEARVVSQETVSLEHRKILIGLVSKFSPRDGNTSSLTEEQRRQALEDADPTQLDLEHSNLWPLISAIRHYPKLEHCWLIASSGESGSLTSARVIATYFGRINAKPIFHVGPPWIVTRPFEPQVAGDIKRLVEAAIEEAQKLGYSSGEIVTDITGGTVPMSFGAVLACVDPKSDVQYTGTTNKTNRLEPVVFGFAHEKKDALS